MQRYFSEFSGTFALVFLGTTAIVVNEQTQGDIGHAGIALSFGLVVLAMIYSFGNISGAHFNPAVTVAFWLAGLFKGKQLLPYLTAQLCGALAASLLVKALFPDSLNLGATLPAGSYSQSFILETILSYILMTVILHVSHGSKEVGIMAGIAIGATVALEAMVAGPICGASMNPARSIAPALVSGNIQVLWIYLLAPVIGMAAAAGVWKKLHRKVINTEQIPE